MSVSYAGLPGLPILGATRMLFSMVLIALETEGGAPEALRPSGAPPTPSAEEAVVYGLWTGRL